MKEYRYNLELFKEIKRFITYRQKLGFESFVVNIVGNVLAFAPFGFMLPLLNSRYRKLIFTTFLSFLFSLSVELIQLYLKVGIFDVDDLLLNTLGGLLGYLFFGVCFIVRSWIWPETKKNIARTRGVKRSRVAKKSRGGKNEAF